MKRLADKATAQRVHPYAWIWEPLERLPAFELRSMFGAKAVYFDGKLVLCFSAKEEPWRGVLVCTDQSHHASLLADFPCLVNHPVLPKWLYLSESLDAFDQTAERLAALVARRDPRIGVLPQPRRRAKTKRR